MSTETIEKPVEKHATETASQKAEPLLKENGLGLSEFLKPTAKETPDAIPPVTPVPVAEVPAEAKPAEEKAKEPIKEEPSKAEDKDAKDLAKLQKQLKDTRDAFTQERQTNKTLLTKMQTLENNIGILTKKIDGTYDEARDAEKPPTVQETEAAAETRATIRTSHYAAVEYLMARDGLTEEQADTKVKELVWSEDAPFRAFDQDRAIQARVMGAKVPIIEALKVVREAEDKKKYGADPATIRKNLEKELTPQLEQKIRDKLFKEFRDKGVILDEVKGLGDVRSVSPERAPQVEARQTLESLFPNFKP